MQLDKHIANYYPQNNLQYFMTLITETNWRTKYAPTSRAYSYRLPSSNGSIIGFIQP